MTPPEAPQVVAHRGASHDVAEHTLGAYLAALDDGADALECDVRLTADGHLVCVHDRDLRRVAGQRRLISTMELAELAELDVASWKHPWSDLDDEAPQRVDEGGTVLTLRALLETVAGLDRRIEVAVETKHPTRYGGLVEKRLADLLRDFGWDRDDPPVRVMSFSNTALHRMQRTAPDVPVVQLLEKAHHWPMVRRMVPEHWTIGPDVAELRDHPGLGRRLVDSGREVHSWVVNTPDDVAVCRRYGVSALITDKPHYLRGLVDDPGRSESPGPSGGVAR